MGKSRSALAQEYCWKHRALVGVLLVVALSVTYFTTCTLVNTDGDSSFAIIIDTSEKHNYTIKIEEERSAVPDKMDKDHVIETPVLLDYIHKQCEKHNFRTTWRDPDSVTMEEDQPRLLILVEKYNFLYSSNPKSGSTSFKKFIRRLEGSVTDYAKMKGIHNNSYVKFDEYVKAHEKLAYKQLLDRYYKIGFIRNPINRLISGFRDKILRMPYSKFNKEIAKRGVKKADSDVERFRVFLELVVSNKVKEKHFYPQWKKMALCSFPYNMLGQTETTSQQIKIIQNKTRTTEYSFPGSRTSVGDDTTSSVALAHRYFDGITPETMAAFYKYFKWDFELTGYTTLNETNFPFIDVNRKQLT